MTRPGRRETDHARAREFAVKWALRATEGEIGNLARAYLRALLLIEELSRDDLSVGERRQIRARLQAIESRIDAAIASESAKGVA